MMSQLDDYESSVDSDETRIEEEKEPDVIPATPRKPRRQRKFPQNISKDYVFDGGQHQETTCTSSKLMFRAYMVFNHSFKIIWN